MKKKIGIIIPYFGHFPEWISFFVESCKRNSFIDFIIYSDDKLKYSADNIIFHYISFQDYCKKISLSLGIEFAPRSAYKLCGVRPFYGYIHNEDLKDYNFWGFCDLDLVFGNLIKYFTESNLRKYDVISTDWDRISGPLCIFRNNEFYNTIGFKIPGWKEKLISDKNIPMDEKYLTDILAIELKILRGIDTKLLRPVFPINVVKKIDYYISLPFHFLLTRRRMLFSNLNCSPEIGNSSMCYVYNNNTIFEQKTNTEIPYLHFLFFKKNLYRKEYLWDSSSCLNTDNLDYNSPIIINKKGIYNINGNSK